MAEQDDSILVAATASDADWALNLLAEPGCVVTIGERSFRALAEVLDEADERRHRAIRELILRYGAPSEGLGSGLAFALHPEPGAA